MPWGGLGPALSDGRPRGDADTQSSVTAGQVPLEGTRGQPACGDAGVWGRELQTGEAMEGYSGSPR